MGGGASKKEPILYPTTLKTQHGSEYLVTDGKEVVFNDNKVQFDYRKNTFYTSRCFTLSPQQTFEITVTDGAVIRIGLLYEQPQQEDFEQRAFFETEDGFEAGISHRCFRLNAINYLRYGEPGAEREYIEINTEEQIWLYVLVLNGSPNISAVHGQTVVTWSSFNNTNIGFSNADTEAVCGLVTAAEQCMMVDNVEPGKTYLIRWNMKLKEVAGKLPKFGFMRLGLLFEDKPIQGFAHKYFTDSSFVWCCESAIRTYPYSGTIALKVDGGNCSITHNLLESSVGRTATMKQLPPDKLKSGNIRLIVELSSGELIIEYGVGVPVEQPFGSIVFVKTEKEFTNKRQQQLAMEKATEYEPYRIIYGAHPTSFVAEFNKKLPDTKNMGRKMSATFELLKETKTIQAIRGNEDLDEFNDVYLFFTGEKRCGGGDIDSIRKSDTVKGSWIITFKSAQVAREVLKSEQYCIDGKSVQVLPYYNELGCSVNNGEKPKYDRGPLIVKLDMIDSDKIRFVKDRPKEKEKLRTFMKQKVAVHLVWSDDYNETNDDDEDDDDDDVVELECKIPVNEFEKLTNWKDRAKTMLETFFAENVIEKTVGVQSQVWGKSLNLVEELANKRDFHFVSDEISHTIKLISSNQMNLSSIADEVGKIVPPRKIDSYKLTKVQSEKYMALEVENKIQPLRKQYTGIKVSVDKKNIEVTLTGPDVEVEQMKTKLLKLFLEVKEFATRVSSEYENVARKARRELGYALKDAGLNETVKIKNRSITIFLYCSDDKSESQKKTKFEQIIDGFIQTNDIRLGDEVLEVFSTDSWRVCKETIEKSFATEIKIQRQKKSMQICALKSQQNDVKTEVEAFLTEHSVGTEAVRVSQDAAEYLATHSTELHGYKNISFAQKEGEYTGKLMVKGNEATKDQAKQLILSLAKSIESCWFLLSKPWLTRVIEAIPIDRIAAQHASVISVESGDSLAENSIAAVAVLEGRGVAVQVIQTDITQLCVDVVVNPAEPDLSMNSRIALRLLQTGGQVIQTECSDYVKNRGTVAEGDVVITSAGLLPFESVFHVVGPQWKGGANNQVVLFSSCIKKVLQMAADRGLATLALPMLSYGNDRFHIDKACELTIQAVADFFQTRNTKNLTSLFLCAVTNDVIDKLAELMQTHLQKNWSVFRHHKPLPVFDTGHEYRPRSGRPQSGRPRSAAGKRHEFAWAKPKGGFSQTIKWMGASSIKEQSEELDDNAEEKDEDKLKDVFTGGLPFQINIAHNVTLHVVKGEIQKQKVDVIVCPTFSFPDINGAVANAIKGGAGDQLVAECHGLATLDIGEVKRTSGGTLTCKHVYHVMIHTSWGEKTYTTVSQLVEKCLRNASQYRCTSIAFPAFGTGQSRYPASKVAGAVIKSVQSFVSKNSASTVKNIFFVVYYADMNTIGAFEGSIPSLFQSDSKGMSPMPEKRTERQSDKGWQDGRRYNRPTNTKGSASHTAADNIALFKVISKIPSIKVKGDIEECVNNEFITAEINIQFEEKEDRLSSAENAQLKDLGTKFEIEIDIDGTKQPPVLRWSGYRVGVKRAEPEIQDLVIRKFPDVRLKSKMAQNIAQHIQWLYEEHGKLKEVPTECILDIHFGYLKREDFTYKNGSTMFKVNVQDLTEYPLGQPNKKRQLILRQKINKDIQLPDSWSIKQSGHESNKLTLDINDNEFNDVKKKIIAAGCQPQQILQIFRIENKYMWQQYQSKKLQLEKQNPQGVRNERELWHGTDSTTADIITRKGYDRSFSGKNAHVYGRGVYFATDSSYSDRYAKPDANGVRRMFLNNVLTGEFTRVGEDDYVLPTKTQTSSEIILFDSGVDNKKNPSIFVIFHDTQAYPLYLIEYKT